MLLVSQKGELVPFPLRLFYLVWGPHKWEAFGTSGTWRMRRWNGDHFEYRDPTPEELEDAAAVWAMR